MARTHRTIITTSLILLFGMTLLVMGRPASAGPVTGASAGVAPFTKVGVYQGILSIVQSSSPGAVMELGAYNATNGGVDLAGTGDIYLRPGQGVGLVVGQTCGSNLPCGVRVYKQSAAVPVANVYVRGSVCLYPTGIGGATDCRNTWPTATNGSWEVVQETVYGAGPYNYLQPTTISGVPGTHWGVHVGSTSAYMPVSTNGPALNLVPQDPYHNGLHVQNTDSTGYAIDTLGKMTMLGNVVSTGTLMINGQEAWHPSGFSIAANAGLHSGLDADTLDGVDFTIQPATTCQGQDANAVACVCFAFAGLPSPGKCTGLANRI